MFAYFRAPVPWIELGRRTAAETFEDGCPGLAAQLAFYFLLGVFPALMFVVALLSYTPIEAALGSALASADTVIPQEVTGILRQELDLIAEGANGGLLTFSIAGAIWSSSSAMTAIITALNRAYDIDEFRPWWKVRALSVGLTIALAVFAVAAFVLILGGTDLAAWIAERAGWSDRFASLWWLIQWPLVLTLTMLAVDLVYYFAPNAETRWVWITPGSILATALWLLVSYAFKIYVHTFGDYSAVYGAIAGVIVLLLWLYLSGFALLIGAELNAEIDHALPARDRDPGPAGAPKKIGPAADVTVAPET